MIADIGNIVAARTMAMNLRPQHVIEAGYPRDDDVLVVKDVLTVADVDARARPRGAIVQHAAFVGIRGRGRLPDSAMP